jgi:hypothetical protein
VLLQRVIKELVGASIGPRQFPRAVQAAAALRQAAVQQTRPAAFNAYLDQVRVKCRNALRHSMACSRQRQGQCSDTSVLRKQQVRCSWQPMRCGVAAQLCKTIVKQVRHCAEHSSATQGWQLADLHLAVLPNEQC